MSISSDETRYMRSHKKKILSATARWVMINLFVYMLQIKLHKISESLLSAGQYTEFFFEK